MARADNRDYLDGQMTATINWPIVAAIYPDLPFNSDGLIVANQPWSGAYTVGKQLWVTAQTTQFTAPGWTYINSASGYLQGSRSDGSYVTLKSPNGSDWSSIIETMDATAAQTVTYNVTGGLSTGTVHVWSTNVNSSSPANWFVHSADITPSGGSFSLTLQPGYVYSLTTTTGQGKGTAASPAQGTLTLPYSDSFDSDTTGQQPRYLAQQQGAFEVGPCAGGRSGQCLDQQAAVKPVEWANDANPYTIGGNLSWANYTVSADALLQQAGAVQFMGRVGTQKGFSPADINAYYFQVANTGAWSIFRNNTSGTITTLASGTAAALGTGTWHHLALTLNGHTISGAIDGATVGSVTDSTFAGGMVGLGVNGYQTDQFDNLSVTPLGSTTPTGPIIAGDNTAKCVRRQRELQRQRHQGADVGLQRHRGAELDHRNRRHDPHQRLLCGHHRRRDGQRDPDRAVDLQRRGQPAMAASERDAGEPGVRPVPGRPWVQHHQRHPAGDLGLQRRLEPAVGHPLTAPPLTVASASGTPPAAAPPGHRSGAPVSSTSAEVQSAEVRRAAQALELAERGDVRRRRVVRAHVLLRGDRQHR